MPKADTLRIEHVAADGTTSPSSRTASRCRRARSSTPRSCAARRSTRSSPSRSPTPRPRASCSPLHLKATMMKVSDPIIFGHAVRAFFPERLREARDALARAGADPNNGLGSVLTALERSPTTSARRSRTRSPPPSRAGRDIAMVDSDRGITNLHVPSDVIIDASMPAMIRTSGQMWNARGRPAGHQGRHPRLAATPRCTRRRSTSAASTAPSTRRRWARRRTSASWRRRPRSTARTTRRSRSRRRAPSASWTPRAPRCSSSPSRPATSSAPARRSTRRSSTGSAWRSRARGRPAPPPSSGSTRRAPTTPSC